LFKYVIEYVFYIELFGIPLNNYEIYILDI